jgi:hypothetical protein
MDKSKNAVNLSVISHRQKPLESKYIFLFIKIFDQELMCHWKEDQSANTTSYIHPASKSGICKT